MLGQISLGGERVKCWLKLAKMWGGGVSSKNMTPYINSACPSTSITHLSTAPMQRDLWSRGCSQRCLSLSQ